MMSHSASTLAFTTAANKQWCVRVTVEQTTSAGNCSGNTQRPSWGKLHPVPPSIRACSLAPATHLAIELNDEGGDLVVLHRIRHLARVVPSASRRIPLVSGEQNRKGECVETVR